MNPIHDVYDKIAIRQMLNRHDATQKPMPFIVGAARSGTTLLRLMLDAHSMLAIPPETGFVVGVARLIAPTIMARRRLFNLVTHFPKLAPGWADFGIDKADFWQRLAEIRDFNTSKGCRCFYQMYAARHNKPRWGDKTPYYCRNLCLIEKLLPEAHFIHIIRDGRDVALSLRDMWFAPGRDITTLARTWQRDILRAQQQGRHCRHYLEVRYEDLINNAPMILRQVCTFIQLPFEENMLRYHEKAAERLAEHQGRYRDDGRPIVTREQRLQQQHLTLQAPDRSRIQNWKRGMSLSEQRTFEKIAGRLLSELGY